MVKFILYSLIVLVLGLIICVVNGVMCQYYVMVELLDWQVSELLRLSCILLYVLLGYGEVQFISVVLKQFNMEFVLDM